LITYNPILQSLILPSGLHCEVLRLDLLHPVISGNKWFKLKYNLASATESGTDLIVTAGGPHSNHIAATAAACSELGFKSIAIIRGQNVDTPTIQNARLAGMQIIFVDRYVYADKNGDAFRYLLSSLGRHYFIPEGGSSCEGLKGCMEILAPGMDHELVFAACGTGTTFAGLVCAAGMNQRVTGISVLKGENSLHRDVMNLIQDCTGRVITVSGNEGIADLSGHCVTNGYAFSGYARADERLLRFKTDFEKKCNVPLDHVYTVKLFYAVDDLAEKGIIPAGARTLVVHSGGLQGNVAFESRYQARPMR
jgi:1-aminocyclopropane-1-carboxylate deaminase